MRAASRAWSTKGATSSTAEANAVNADDAHTDKDRIGESASSSDDPMRQRSSDSREEENQEQQTTEDSFRTARESTWCESEEPVTEEATEKEVSVND